MESSEKTTALSSNFLGISDGAVYMLLAALSFSVMNVCIKMVTHIPPMQVVFFRCFTAMLIAFFYVFKSGTNWVGSNRKLLFLRGFFGTVALYTFFLTIQNMPLASAVTIQYLSPIFTTIVAMFLLKEKEKIFNGCFLQCRLRECCLLKDSTRAFQFFICWWALLLPSFLHWLTIWCAV